MEVEKSHVELNDVKKFSVEKFLKALEILKKRNMSFIASPRVTVEIYRNRVYIGTPTHNITIDSLDGCEINELAKKYVENAMLWKSNAPGKIIVKIDKAGHVQYYHNSKKCVKKFNAVRINGQKYWMDYLDCSGNAFGNERGEIIVLGRKYFTYRNGKIDVLLEINNYGSKPITDDNVIKYVLPFVDIKKVKALSGNDRSRVFSFLYSSGWKCFYGDVKILGKYTIVKKVPYREGMYDIQVPTDYTGPDPLSFESIKEVEKLGVPVKKRSIGVYEYFGKADKIISIFSSRNWYTFVGVWKGVVYAADGGNFYMYTGSRFKPRDCSVNLSSKSWRKVSREEIEFLLSMESSKEAKLFAKSYLF